MTKTVIILLQKHKWVNYMNKARKIIKIVGLVALFSFCSAMILRIIFSQYYPASVSKIYYSDSLSEFYRENGGISPKTQHIRIYHDDSGTGAFYASKLIFEENAGNLQVTLRYNDSALDDIADFYKKDKVEAGENKFTYRIFAYKGLDDDGNIVGDSYDTSAVIHDRLWFYNYDKAVFDGVDFNGVELIEVDIYLAGEEEMFSHIVIFENTESFSKFSEYKLSSSEVPT